MDIKKAYESWLNGECFDEDTKKELAAIADNESEINDRFYRDLEFGTAGLRGIIGAGTNRMNFYTVRKATQGLANYIISEKKQDRGVVISYDSRNFSPEFADEAALCLAANGIKAYVFTSLRPTPVLSYAVRKLKAIAGINITASHNPPAYNGYKVYWEDGAQISPPHDKGIIDSVNAITDYSVPKTMQKEEATSKGLYIPIDKEIDDPYNEEILALVSDKESIKKMAGDIRIVYTPLHGTGNIPVRRVLKELGFEHVYVVEEQEKPDGNFPTVSYPNPEAAEAFELGLKLAKEKDADLVLATDPDADRLGVYVKDNHGEYHCLTGNMSGCLIGEYIIKSKKEKEGKLPQDGAFIKSIVSSKLCDAIAKYYDIRLIEVLTGFKFIGKEMLGFEQSGKGTYLFGMEESYGCLPGTYARDKDAVAAVVILCEAAAHYKAAGKNMWEAMLSLYETYGYYEEDVLSLEFSGMEGAQKMKDIMNHIRTNPFKEVSGYAVESIRDYGNDTIVNVKDNTTKPSGLPKSNVVYYDLSDDAWMCVRPSGTEPKIKLYFGVKADSMENVKTQSAKMKSFLRDFANGF